MFIESNLYISFATSKLLAIFLFVNYYKSMLYTEWKFIFHQYRYTRINKTDRTSVDEVKRKCNRLHHWSVFNELTVRRVTISSGLSKGESQWIWATRQTVQSDFIPQRVLAKGRNGKKTIRPSCHRHSPLFSSKRADRPYLCHMLLLLPNNVGRSPLGSLPSKTDYG